MILRRHFLIEGRVQGVGFRHWTARKAQEMDVSGFVRNLPGGSVEVQAQGEERSLELFEKWLRKGPSSARVDRVTAVARPVEKSEDGFRIRHF